MQCKCLYVLFIATASMQHAVQVFVFYIICCVVHSVCMMVLQFLGSFVGRVEATDVEQGDLLYSLEPTADSQYFTIDPSTGNITNAQTLDRESEVGGRHLLQ